MPDDNASSNGDIHGVFGAKLGNFKAAIGDIDYFLMNTFHLIA